MKTPTILVLLVATLVVLPYASAVPRSETQNFVVGNGAGTVYTSANAGTDFDVGGNRFFLEGDESSVTITVNANGLPSNNGLNFYNGAGTVIKRAPFCTSTTVAIPLDAVRFVVFVGSDATGIALNSLSCGVAVAPPAGSITADFV